VDIYGLTGGIGSGKSTVAELLEEYGIPVVSADELARVVVARGSEGLRDVVAHFGPEVLDEHGELDRRKMAGIVFHDAGRRRELEAILHPRIRERYEQVLDALEKAGHTVVIYEVPLLFEKNLQGDMKAVILVTADEGTRIARVRARDDVTEQEVRARMAAQMDEETKRKRADYVIDNSGTLDQLRREIEFLIARFLRLDPPARNDAAPARVARGGTLRVAALPSSTATQVPGGAFDDAVPWSGEPTQPGVLAPTPSDPNVERPAQTDRYPGVPPSPERKG
jgi:dephospho-CoA kinase